MQSIDREPLFCIQFAKQNVYPIVSAVQVFLKNTVGKGEIAHNEQFLLFPQCFLTIWKTFCQFPQIWNCHLQTLLSFKGSKIGRSGKS